MKKLIVAVLAFVILVGFSAQNNVEAAKRVVNPNKNSHVVFYIPHQDDEALTFGVSVMNHVKAGHVVHVVLLTDGAASAVRKKMNMAEIEFTEARNREFKLSLTAMGVKPENVEFMNFKDSQLTVKNVEGVVKKYEAKYPKAKHKTFSWTDSGNHDHANAGKALSKLQKTKTVTDARYYVRRGDNPKGLRLTTERYNPLHKAAYQAVSKAYSTIDVENGLYGIGRKSVKKSFIAFDQKPLSRYHR